MAVETVDISILSDDLVPVPVDGVNVQVYDETGTTLITSGITGAVTTGHIEFSLNGDDPPTVYTLRFSITGGSITSPQQIEVYSPPANAPTGANNFEITATLFTLSQASDPRLCRASGYIRSPDGRPKRGIDIHWIPCDSPLVVDGIGILGERVASRSDVYGYVQIDLYRNGYYLAVIDTLQDRQREITVPDRASININHLLFPIVATAVFDPVGPYALAVDEELVLVPTITANNYLVLDGAASDDVAYAVEDDTVASVTINSEGNLVIRGISAGTTTLQLTRVDTSIVYLPDTGIELGDVTITVT